MTTDEIPSSCPDPVDAADARPEETYNIRIGRDGAWRHDGAPIGRMALVKLFATVLRRDDVGDYWLITPAERGRIVVEDAPFVAVELRVEGAREDQVLSFRTNVDDWVTADSAHPIEFRPVAVGSSDLSEERAPYILVRDRLEARIGRAVFYELVELAVERATGQGIELGIWSRQVFFPLGIVAPTESPR